MSQGADITIIMMRRRFISIFAFPIYEKKYEIVILSGGARGADAIGERYAKENGFKIEKHPAAWNIYGKSAGPRRNKQMAEACDFVICFWDGQSRGTESMIEFAKQYNKPFRIKRIL